MAASATWSKPSDDVLSAVLDVASRAARQAGNRMRAASGSAEVHKVKSNDKDLVTIVDKQCQEDVEAHIRDNFPDHEILGEESVDPGSEASAAALARHEAADWLWIIDPIDGTTNFVHGIPLSVVSIGIAHRGCLVVGIVYDPYRNELFQAVLGRGAFLNGVRILASKETEIGRSLLTFGTHTQARVRDTQLRGVGKLGGMARAVRNFGTAALHLAWVACGRASAFWELDLSSWDLAGGVLLVQEAGGRVSDTRGEPYTIATRDILAACTDSVHTSILTALKEVDADRLPPIA